MGIQGPLTAQALGRSPYDDVFQGEGAEEGKEPSQQYDHRGRPINPESKRINKDIIRSHNEVMLVVGVAEPENSHTDPETEAKRQHILCEDAIGSQIIWATKRCIEAVGVFGVTGFRQRILIYRHYTTTPLWHIHQLARTDFSITRDMLPGAPITLFTQYVERRWFSRPIHLGQRALSSKILRGGWYYIRVHLELYAAFQRLGLISNRYLLPSWRYFIPFTDESPIPCPPPMEDISTGSIMRWLSGVVVSATPLLLWAITEELAEDWRPKIWRKLLDLLPSPVFIPKTPSPLPPPPSPPSIGDDIESPVQEVPERHGGARQEAQEDSPEADTEMAQDEDIVTSIEVEAIMEQEAEPMHRSSVPSVADGGDDFDSDDDENEVVSATLISFDVEATEATDVPSGLWSAELRPTVSPEVRPPGFLGVLFMSTTLTRLPAFMASKILSDSIMRILFAPYHAMALRLAARAFRLRHGLPVTDILGVHPLSGFCLTWFVNFVGAELISLSICAEIWAVASSLARYFHMSEEKWLETGGYEWKYIIRPDRYPESLV